MATKYFLIAALFSLACILQHSGAAITPVDKTYTAKAKKDFNIPWIFDDEADLDQVLWTYKSSASATTTTIMSKAGTDSAQIFNNFNVEHVSNGEIKLKSVKMDNKGIYFCQVLYTLSSGLPTVTGTATLSVTSDDHEKDCETRSVLSAVFGCLGIIFNGVVIFLILKGFLQKTTKLALIVIDIVLYIISLGLGASVLADPDCADSPDWVIGLAIAFTVISLIGIIEDIILGVLVILGVIKVKEDGHNRGNDGHNGGGVPLAHTKVHAKHEEKSKASLVHAKHEEKSKGSLVQAKHEEESKESLSARADSDSAVSRQDVHVQENKSKLSGRPMPPIPSRQEHDTKGRGLSANYDDDHPMISIGVPDKRAGDLGPLPEEQQKKKKKKKRRTQEEEDEYND